MIARKRPRRGLGVGGLAVVDVDDVAHRGDTLLAMRQAGIAAQALDDPLARHVEPAAGSPGAGSVLRIVVARQSRHIGEVDGITVGIDQTTGTE